VVQHPASISLRSDDRSENSLPKSVEARGDGRAGDGYAPVLLLLRRIPAAMNSLGGPSSHFYDFGPSEVVT
jgi:hypothetical protein